jgi:hypothetical protein
MVLLLLKILAFYSFQIANKTFTKVKLRIEVWESNPIFYHIKILDGVATFEK